MTGNPPQKHRPCQVLTCRLTCAQESQQVSLLYAGISTVSGDGENLQPPGPPKHSRVLALSDLIAQGLGGYSHLQLSIKLPTRVRCDPGSGKEIEVWEGLWQAIIAQPVLSNGRRPAYHQKPMNTQSVFQSDVSLVILLLGRRSFHLLGDAACVSSNASLRACESLDRRWACCNPKF